MTGNRKVEKVSVLLKVLQLCRKCKLLHFLYYQKFGDDGVGSRRIRLDGSLVHDYPTKVVNW
jgi:hypothetical protein